MSRKFIVSILLMSILAVLPLGVLAESNTAATEQKVEVLTLDQCLNLAYQNSQLLKSAQKNVEIAQAAVKEAQAGLGPSLTYQYSDTYFFDKTTSQTGKDQYSNAGLTLSQTLFPNSRLTDTLKLKQISLDSAKENERKAKEQITFNVKQAYFQCWVAGQMVIVANNSLTTLNHHVDQIEAFYKVGTVSRYDVLKAQVQRDSLKPSLIKAQNGLALAKLGLATLIGRDKSQAFNVTLDIAQIKIPEKNLIDASVTLEDAYKNRSELHQMQQLAQINKLATSITETGYKPNIVLSATMGTPRGGTDIIPDKWGMTVNLMISGVIYNGGATQAKVDQAKKNEELTAIQEAGIRDQIRTEVEQALQGITEGIETVKYNQANIDLAKEGLRMAQARFDAGMGTTMDLMDAQNALDQALNGYYSGVSNYLTAVAKLDMVTANDK